MAVSYGDVHTQQNIAKLFSRHISEIEQETQWFDRRVILSLSESER